MFGINGGWRALVVGFALVAMVVAEASAGETAGKAAGEAGPFTSGPAAAETFEAGTLHVERFGAGPQAIVCVPGLAGGSWVWWDAIGRLGDGYTIYVITLPGFDGRAATDQKPLFAAFARDFWAMLEAHKIQKPVVIGHSLGGTLAIALGEEHAERLAGIVAVDGLPVFPMLAGATAQQREAMGARMAAMYAGLSKEQVFAAQKEFMSKVGTCKAELVEPAARRQARSDPAAIGAWMQETLSRDLRPNLGKVTVPTLVVMPFDPEEAKAGQTQEQKKVFYESLVAGAPKARVVAVGPARHFVMLDEPEGFVKVVKEFLGVVAPE